MYYTANGGPRMAKPLRSHNGRYQLRFGHPSRKTKGREKGLGRKLLSSSEVEELYPVMYDGKKRAANDK